jgi:hypothetical protein
VAVVGVDAAAGTAAPEAGCVAAGVDAAAGADAADAPVAGAAALAPSGAAGVAVWSSSP